ncbi:unnamed protein product [Prorocentrum cordatum]|uniref:Secreted protein n=1 Tax=Prorocentrum cordatum TaxID=2364126 RepID=A0ABN9PES2_9DINO|nr:unnamed protein product [Polarella glacialis]
MSARGARVPSLLLACLPLCHHRSGSQVRREARAPSRMQRVPRDVRPVRAERRRLAPCLHSCSYPSAVSAAILWHRPALDSDVLRPQLAGAPCALFFWAYHARAAWLQVHLVFFEFPTDASICLTLAPGGVVQHRPGGSAPRPVWRFGCPRGLSGGHARRRSSEGCQPCARALGSTELESRTCHVGAPSPSSSARLLLRRLPPPPLSVPRPPSSALHLFLETTGALFPLRPRSALAGTPRVRLAPSPAGQGGCSDRPWIGRPGASQSFHEV